MTGVTGTITISPEVAAAIVRSNFTPKYLQSEYNENDQLVAEILVEDVSKIAREGAELLGKSLRIEGTMQKEK